MSALSATTRALEVDEVLGLDRVGLVVGEGAVELEVQRHQVDVVAAEPVEHRGRGVPGHAVAGVDDHLETPARDRGEVEQVRGVRLEDVALADRPRGCVPREPHRERDEVADLGQAGVLADRLGVRRGTS